ncbi:fibronectin type III domain-containing protein [candidate division KSB1 bacterium]|nr:fibronectin type III domain-containing protein [candidate division KSB1 bacterium]
MLHRYKKSFLLELCSGLVAALLFALSLPSTAQTLVQDRQYEHVQVSPLNLAEFSGSVAPVGHLFLYAYKNGGWQQIPLQIDERDGSGSYFAADDGALDDNDQLLFLARDAGSQAPVNDWVNDASARSFPRYEIRLIDPLTSQEAFVYLYRSTTLAPDPLLPTYMQYSPSPAGRVAADTVKGISYIQGHANNGVPDYLAVPPSFGGSGIDFLDRLKIRIRAIVSVPIVGNQTVTANEQDNLIAVNNSLKAISGRIRVIREVQEQIRVSVLGVNVDVSTVAISLFFYPFSQQLSGQIPLTSDLGARLLRTTFDFNSNMANQTWYNKNTTTPRTITGASGGITEQQGAINFLPERNWFSASSSQHGSFVGIFGMDNILNTTQKYYFWDAMSGTGDGTNDTGDGRSYGDSGFIIQSTGSNPIVATFQLGVSSYILGPNLTREQAVALNANTEAPMAHVYNLQNYDAVAPAAVADLRVTNSTPTTVSLAWTAPADVGSNVASYELGYSTTQVGNDVNLWFDTIASKAGNLPAPGAPGATEVATVNNLVTGSRYFFVLRSRDAFGNASPFSNIATIDAVPVELATFSVQVERDQAELSWSTASETNNLGFHLERKQGNNTWQEIGFINGHGTTLLTQNYSFVDRDLQPGVYSYRLRQVDFNGAFEYSPEIIATVSAPQRFVLAQSYPNPLLHASSGTLIRYELPHSAPQPVELRIFNLLGREVRQLVHENQNGGYYEVRWDGRLANGEHAAAGIYFYELRSAGFRAIQKLTIVR